MGKQDTEVKIGKMRGGHRVGFPLCKGMDVPYNALDLFIVKDHGEDYNLTVEFCLNALRKDENQIALENFWLGADNKQEVVSVLRQLLFRVNQGDKGYGSIGALYNTTIPLPVPEKENNTTRILNKSLACLIGALIGAMISYIILL